MFGAMPAATPVVTLLAWVIIRVFESRRPGPAARED